MAVKLKSADTVVGVTETIGGGVVGVAVVPATSARHCCAWGSAIVDRDFIGQGDGVASVVVSVVDLAADSVGYV